MSEIMAVSAARGAYRETADGSLEVKIIIDPRYKDDFHRLFRDKDMPVALAPLVANFERIQPCAQDDYLPPKTEPKPDNSNGSSPVHHKGGELAKWAGILSNDPVFWQWADVFEDAEQAAEWIRAACHISSRAELDHDQQAAKIFRNLMANFDDWKNGGAAA